MPLQNKDDLRFLQMRDLRLKIHSFKRISFRIKWGLHNLQIWKIWIFKISCSIQDLLLFIYLKSQKNERVLQWLDVFVNNQLRNSSNEREIIVFFSFLVPSAAPSTSAKYQQTCLKPRWQAEKAKDCCPCNQKTKNKKILSFATKNRSSSNVVKQPKAYQARLCGPFFFFSTDWDSFRFPCSLWKQAEGPEAIAGGCCSCQNPKVNWISIKNLFGPDIDSRIKISDSLRFLASSICFYVRSVVLGWEILIWTWKCAPRLSFLDAFAHWVRCQIVFSGMQFR